MSSSDVTNRVGRALKELHSSRDLDHLVPLGLAILFVAGTTTGLDLVKTNLSMESASARSRSCWLLDLGPEPPPQCLLVFFHGQKKRLLSVE